MSQQLKLAVGLEDVHPQVLLEAASAILKALAAEHGCTRLAARSAEVAHPLGMSTTKLGLEP